MNWDERAEDYAKKNQPSRMDADAYTTGVIDGARMIRAALTSDEVVMDAVDALMDAETTDPVEIARIVLRAAQNR